MILRNFNKQPRPRRKNRWGCHWRLEDDSVESRKARAVGDQKQTVRADGVLPPHPQASVRPLHLFVIATKK